MTVSSSQPRTRRARLGIAAIAVSLVPPVVVVALVALSGSTGGELPAGVVVASFIVLPLIEIAVVVLGISALIANNIVGKIVGLCALIFVVVQVIAGIDLLNELAAL